MKNKFFYAVGITAIAAMSIFFLQCSSTSAKDAVTEQKGAVVKLETYKEKLSYSIGMDFGKNLKKQEFDIDFNILLDGFKTGYNNQPSLLGDTQMRETLMQFQKEMIMKQQEMMAKQQEQMKELGPKNKIEGLKFLDAKKKEKDIVALPGGLLYKIIKKGTGAKPSKTDTIKVHYKGNLITGEVFDSSYDRGTPADISLMQVIQGWQQAIPLMPVGSKWELYIPSELGYGENAPPTIGPNSVLIFEIELLDILKPQK